VRYDRLKSDVIEMRQRMRRKLDKSGSDNFDLKQGKGGIGDIEFIVQFLVLLNAADESSLYFYSDNIRQLDALAAARFLDSGAAARLQKIYKSYRLRLHHLALDDRQALVGQDEFTAEREFVEDLWTQVL
jgi:glutamate-ammonia-ligase adenylyltransferase